MNVYLEIYGCTANKSDASIIKRAIRDKEGYNEVDSVSTADIIVLLTCTVISTTEQRMLHRMRVFKKTGKQVIVTGCMASVQVEKIRMILPDATIVPPSLVHTIFSQDSSSNLELVDPAQKPYAPKYFDSLIAPVSISEGCQYACTYCITHFARGKLISYPEETIFRDVSCAVERGNKEIQITAQDTGSYGMDTGSSLPALVRSLSGIPGEYRLRIGMMNPRSIKNQLEDIIKSYSYDHVYRFIHLPVQSGDNTILRSMNRGYRIEDCANSIETIRENLPDITLATDIIVGFPTETDEQFQHSIDFLKTVEPDITNITRYSARPQTKAKTMKGRIPTEIVKERSKLLTGLCRDISRKRNKRYIGRTEQILLLEKGKDDTLVGRTDSYKPVVIKEDGKLGEFVTVGIVDAKDTYLVGTLK